MPKSAPPQPKSFLFLIISLVIFLILSLFAFYSWTQTQARLRQSQSDYQSLLDLKNNLDTSLASASAELNLVKSEDQFVKNNQLQSEVKDIKSGFSQALKLYEDIVDLRDSRVRVSTIEPLFSSVLSDLSQFKYSQSLSKIATLSAKVTQERQKSLAVVGSVNPDNVTENNTPPGSGFSRQKVKVGDSFFVVDIVAADLNSTRVIVDTASEGDCADNCPVLPLGTYVSRNGAFAGINGSYFCPASYPSCASKKNSFDTLLMNKNKKYFNSDNNVYSTVPAVIFSGASARFVTQSQQWGRDTGVDSVLANYPLLVFNKSLAAGDSSDTKLSAAGNRAFIAAKGSTVYIGVVRGVSVVGAAKVLLEMGMDNALNLDSGGSTALWSGGYKYGPGRDIPNAILFVRK
jgi:hypothetical protein